MSLHKEKFYVFWKNAGMIPKEETLKLKPPHKSSSIFSDIKYFMLHKPSKSTLIQYENDKEREDLTYRILQRLGVEVDSYKILNIHKIGINVPTKYVFEELLNWNGDSTCWPNHMAKVVQSNNSLENLSIYLLGLTKFPNWLKNSYIGRSFIPLFKLNAIVFRKIPDPMASDNARFLLYKSSGGYPIGIFTMYVRSSISEQHEEEQSQLFLMVGFNFYGHASWSKKNLINSIWEAIHDRVTSNVLCRFKQFCEWRFEKIKNS